jgi:ABC-type glycerol-3-phosphate transport system permease component
MVRQYLRAVPDSFLEAARIDGAGEFRIYWRIVLPVLRPVLSAFALLEFLSMWNSYLWPQVMASNSNVAPLGVALPLYTDNVIGAVPLYGAIMAASVLATLPLILIFLRNQRAFMTGVSYGSA